MSNTFSFVVTVSKRDDLEHPANALEASSFIKEKLEEGSFLTVVSVTEGATQ